MFKPTKDTQDFADRLCCYSFFLVLFLSLGCQPTDSLPPEIQKQLAEGTDKKSSSDAGQNQTSEAEDAESNNKADPDSKTTEPAKPVLEQCNVDKTAWVNVDKLPWSYWEAHYVGNTRIGYSSLIVERSELAELKQVRIRREEVLDTAADGSFIPVRRVAMESFERITGEVASFRFESFVDGERELLVEGRQVFGDLEVSTKQGEGQASRQKLPWKSEFWGPLGVQQLLMRSPMKSGELRTTSIFIPQLLKFIPVLLEAKQVELTPMSSGPALPLLQVNLTVATPEGNSTSSIYVDDQGVIQKTLARSANQMVLKIRVDETVMQRLRDQSEFARGLQHSVEFSGEATDTKGATSVVYKVEARDIDPYDALMEYSRQRLKSISPTSCELTILKLEANTLVSEKSPEPADFESSLMIPSDKPPVLELAAEILGGQEGLTSNAKAELIRQGLAGIFKVRDIQPEIVSTLVVSREREGSCIECANLLAALLRSQKIASRIIVGLRIDPKSGQSHFHTWAQAWTEDRWVDLDASSPDGCDMSYIAMRAHSGSGENFYTELLSIFKLIHKLGSVSISKVEKSE